MKLLEAHSGLSALLINKSPAYEGIWISSLTAAAILGLPDNETTSLDDRVSLVSHIRDLGIEKPIYVDVDSFGNLEHIPWNIKRLGRAGATAVVMEDKKGFKQNSLLSNDQPLEDVDVFSEKIRVAKKHCMGVFVVARVESLIAKRSMDEALIRAQAYVMAGADMILIHSKQQVDATEVMEFAERFRKICGVPLVAVPTTYVLPENHPFEVVIEANHMLRASMKAMGEYINHKETELSTVDDIFNLVGH